MRRSLSRWLHRLCRAVAAFSIVIESAVTVLAVRLALTFMGLARVRGWWLPGRLAAAADPLDASRVATAVRFVSHVLPFASCLTQAQAAQIVLARHGVASTVCLGVRQTPTGALAAHAWLLVDGRLVLGGAPHDVGHFRQLAELTSVV